MRMRTAHVLRALRRVALLLPLVLTALALLLLPRPPVLSPARSPLPTSPAPPPLPHNEHYLQNLITEGVEGDDTKDLMKEISFRPWFMRGGEVRPLTHNPSGMFPEDDPGSDRIAQQLMYALPTDEDIPVKKILLANGFSAWNVAQGRTEFLRNKCPVDKCYLTADSRDASTADAILYKDHYTPFNVRRSPKQIWILYYLECPFHTANLRPSSVDVFNWTATYRRDSDIVAPYEKWVYHDDLITEREQDRNYAANKTKKVAWFVSNCHARNHRLQYARQLSKYISVDIYGACGSYHCPRTDPNCLDMLDKDYKFYLAFENSNCKDYVTEKFFVNGLQHNVLPIVMGARAEEYAAIAPHNSYIHVEEFAGVEELAAYLRRLDEDDNLYNSYFKWKGTGEFINTYFFCRVCAMVHANERRNRATHYSDVQAWWRDSTCTRTDWRGMELLP